MMLFSGMTDEDLDQVVNGSDAVQIIKIVDFWPSLYNMYIVVCICYVNSFGFTYRHGD